MTKTNNTSEFHSSRLSVAPMLDWTDLTEKY